MCLSDHTHGSRRVSEDLPIERAIFRSTSGSFLEDVLVSFCSGWYTALQQVSAACYREDKSPVFERTNTFLFRNRPLDGKVIRKRTRSSGVTLCVSWFEEPP